MGRSNLNNEFKDATETHSDDRFGRNSYRMDLLLELELAKVCLAQIESKIVLERSRQKGREHHNQVVDDKVMSYNLTSASHAVDVPPGKDWITMIYKAFDPSKTKII
ncbi:unnamed protein product, partial [Schistosoma mattheei]